MRYELLLKTPDALNLDASQAANVDLDAFIGREIGCENAATCSAGSRCAPSG